MGGQQGFDPRQYPSSIIVRRDPDDITPSGGLTEDQIRALVQGELVNMRGRVKGWNGGHGGPGDARGGERDENGVGAEGADQYESDEYDSEDQYEETNLTSDAAREAGDEYVFELTDELRMKDQSKIAIEKLNDLWLSKSWHSCSMSAYGEYCHPGTHFTLHWHMRAY